MSSYIVPYDISTGSLLQKTPPCSPFQQAMGGEDLEKQPSWVCGTTRVNGPGRAFWKNVWQRRFWTPRGQQRDV